MISTINGKKDIFNKLSVFTSLKEIELKPNNLFNSISTIDNNKDAVPFLLDLSTSLVGSDGLQNKFGQLFTQFIEKYNISSKNILKKEFLNFNTDNQLPSDFVNNGIDIPISLLDDFNDLKTTKADPIGELIYDDNTENLLTKLKNSIISPSTTVNHNNISLIYNELNQTINIKPIGSGNIGSFIETYINGKSNLNVKKTVAEILDKIYGIKSKQQNKTVKEIYEENLIDKIIDKIINEESVELSDEESDELNNISEEIAKGYNEIDLGCGFIINTLTLTELNNISNNLNNNTDPNDVGNVVVNLFVNSLDENSNKSNTTALKDSFIKRIINTLKNILIKNLIFSPEIKLLFYLSQYFKNNTNLISDKIEFVNQNYNIIDCVIKNITSDFVKFIFDMVKTEILEVTKPALNKIIKEKINNYTLILRSLVRI